MYKKSHILMQSFMLCGYIYAASPHHIAHLNLLCEFKQKHTINERPQPTLVEGDSPTQIYLRNEELHKLVNTEWPRAFKDYGHIIDTIIREEERHCGNHYVFYHAQESNHRVVQDVISELFHLFELPNALRKDFIFLRPWNLPNTPKTVAHFFDDVAKKQDVLDIYNNTDEFRPLLISVNPSLFNNIKLIRGNECSFDYFISNKSCIRDVGSTLERTLWSFGLNYSDDLAQLIEQYPFYRGQLIQIFIPKDAIDRVAYSSHPNGRPHTKTICMQKKLEEFLAQRMPTHEMDALQARIVVTPEFLDPQSNTIMHRYQLSLTQKQEAAYHKQLQKIVSDLVAQAYRAGTLKLPNGCRAKRLLAYLQGTPGTPS